MKCEIESLEPGTWVNITATVFQIWENKHPAIRQVGLLKDGTGIVKFVSWEKSDLPLLEVGALYKFNGLPVTGYDGQVSVGLVYTTQITKLEKGLKDPHKV